MNIYYEKQVGDYCRLHSLNAFFGRNHISIEKFKKYCNDYDNIIKGINTINHDGFSEGRNIISYILDILTQKYTLLIPIDSYKKSRNEINIKHYNKLIKSITQFFEFNKNHVWFNRKINNKWYKIDSITGISNFDFNRLSSNGYILIIENRLLFDELKFYINNLKKSYDEVLLYNLYYILKNIKLKKINNSVYDSNITLLKHIKIYLNDYINYKHYKKYDSIYEKQLIKKIQNCLKLINS